MADHKPDYLAGNESENALPGLEAARAQIAAARVRREVLIAAGRLPGSLSESASIPAKTLPGYALLRELHRGGQGVVYLALQQSTGREVAVKILRQGPLAAPADLARFQREVEVLGRLKHPNIVTIHDCGRAGEDVYLVMDYVAGRPLDEYVRRKVETSKSRKVEIEEVLELFTTVCDGVNAAHLRGVIHRDLKPSNILVVDEASIDKFSRDSKRSAVELPASRSSDESRLNLGEPKILDFGLAKLVADPADGSSAQAMTLTGQFVGSLPWASPEQAEGRSDALDIRTDVYSLGVILYQLLTGQFPYPVAGRMDEVVRHIVQSSPARPSAVEKSIGHEVETILLKCLAKEPERRYQSAGELARDIRHYLANEPIEAKRDSMSYVLRKQFRRHWVAVVVVASFALLLAGGLVTSLTLWYRAERALVEKEAQRKLADQRADETQKVAEFQSKMLSDINVKMAGIGLRTRLIDKRRAALQAAGSDESQVEAGLRDVDASLAGVNFTSVALETLDENVFARALQAVDNQFADQPVVKAQLLQSLASTLKGLGLFDRATGPLEEALRIRREAVGDEQPDTLTSIHDLGMLLQAQGKLLEAEPFLRESMDKRRRVLGDDHPDTLTSIHDMGYLLKVQGKLAEAEPYYKEALEKRRRSLGDDHLSTLTSINDMGGLLRAQGKPAEAEPYYREALERKRRTLGEEHPNTLTSISNMGHFVLAQGKLADAEVYFREALEKRRRVLGDEHPETLFSINDMGFLRHTEGELPEAEEYFREALEKRRRVLGDNHPETLMSIGNMGALMHARGKLAEAELYAREVLEKRRSLLGGDHPDTLFSLSNVAVLVQAQGRLEEAESLKRESLDRHRRVLGDDHPETLHATTEMGSLLQDRGRLGEAEGFFRNAMKGCRRVLGDAHPDTLTSMNRMAGLLLVLDKPAEAEPLLREVLAARAAKLPPGHRLIAVTRIGLGRALIKLAADPALSHHERTMKLTEAESQFTQAWDVLGPDPGTPYPNRKQLLGGLADLYDLWDGVDPDQGHDAKAAEWRTNLAEWTASTQPAAP